MLRPEYSAEPLQYTLTGNEDHLPVLCALRIQRKRGRPRKSVPKKVWNKQAFQSTSRRSKYLRDRDLKLKETIAEWTREQENDEKNLDSEPDNKVNRLVEAITDSAEQHIRKKLIYFKYHQTRAEKNKRKG